ncbi:alpha/beta hydrolase [Tritonibacter mobilis]|uniref:alpha/beta fold hydrolase n=1 Tax=Tritonibacter mobilis TaxID=379347 RepID=UPI0039A49347
MSPEQIFALIAALTAEPDPEAFATLKAGGADPAYPVTVAPCARPVAPTEIDGKTVICGTIEVPFDHRAPDGPTIDIAFNLYKAHSLSPQPDPVIYLHGGPGDGTVSRVARTIGFFEHLRGRHDIIAIDERGVDSSAPEMDCYSTLGNQLGDVVEARFQGLEMTVQEQGFVEGCLAELDAKGIDYSLINTEQNAMDVPAVMSALGYDIYNISYGTKLTMEILRQNPPGIRSAVIDGNAPPWLPLYSMFWQSHSAPIQLSLAPCERDPVCAEAYPDIVARTFALYETLGEEPVNGSNGQIDPGTLWGVIDQRVGVKGNYKAITPYIPLMVSQLEQGDATIIDQILSGALPPWRPGCPEPRWRRWRRCCPPPHISRSQKTRSHARRRSLKALSMPTHATPLWPRSSMTALPLRSALCLTRRHVLRSGATTSTCASRSRRSHG